MFSNVIGLKFKRLTPKARYALLPVSTGRVHFLLNVFELLFISLTVEALQGKTCQDSLLSGGGRSLGAKISGRRGRPWGIFFWFLQN